MIISLFWLIPSADQLARMCVILQKLSPPLASFSLQLPLRLSLPPPPPPVQPPSSSCSVVSLLPAIHLSFHSLLWITASVRWESCPNTFALPKQSIAVCLLLPLSFGSACRRERLRRSPGEVTRGPAGQLVLIASRGLGCFFFLLLGGRLVSLAAQM